MDKDTHELQDRDYDAVARHLDGEGNRLDRRQAEAARDIRGDEAWVGNVLDVSPPREALDAARRKLDAALASSAATGRGRRRLWPVLAASAVAAAVAAAVLINAVIPREPLRGRPAVTAEEVVSEFLREEPTALGVQLAMLTDEVTLAWAHLVLDEEFGETSAMDALDEWDSDIWLLDALDSGNADTRGA